MMNGEMNKVLVGLGSNIEPRIDYLHSAIQLIDNSLGEIIGQSSVFETEPMDMSSGTELFLNQVVLLHTPKIPDELLDGCLQIEHKLGRVRGANHYESRTIDIDLLHYEGVVRQSAKLSLPHPKMHERLFVLKPLQEVMPEFIHPVLKKDLEVLINDVSDALVVKLWKSV